MDFAFKDKNSISKARTPQPGEIALYTMRDTSSETVQKSDVHNMFPKWRQHKLVEVHKTISCNNPCICLTYWSGKHSGRANVKGHTTPNGFLRYSPINILKVKVTTARSKVNQAHTMRLQVSISYSLWLRFSLLPDHPPSWTP